jgi:hypothetical protein
MRVVISQSMLFPWVGLLEQIRLADVFVHYDDVQFSKGSFVNRVQIKTPQGVRWMTVPLQGAHLGQRIDELKISPQREWREQHIGLLERSFAGCPFAKEAIRVAEDTYSGTHSSIGDLARASMLALSEYFKIDASTRFVDVQNVDVPGFGSDRVLAVVKRLAGTCYITGHGAAHYLDHEAFSRENIKVEYVNYLRLPYPQLHGEFTPYVSGLDLIANCGRDGAKYICSGTVSWKEFLDGSQ